jgi:hypothetical protein
MSLSLRVLQQCRFRWFVSGAVAGERGDEIEKRLGWATTDSFADDVFALEPPEV